MLSDALSFTENEEKESFDAVYSVESLQHFANGFDALVASVMRILKHGGMFIIERGQPLPALPPAKKGMGGVSAVFSFRFETDQMGTWTEGRRQMVDIITLTDDRQVFRCVGFGR